MPKNEEIIKLYMKSKNMFNELESKPRDFGTGDLLYSSEIHTLVEIGKNRGINLTELANLLNISKSGTSKFIKKLAEKELIIKERADANKKEVVFSVTEKGETACKGHEEFKHLTFAPIINLINDMDEDNKEFLAEFLKDLISLINI